MKKFIVISLFASMCMIGCGDEDQPVDPNPGNNCRVTTYRCESRNETWKIIYDDGGRTESITIGDQLNVDEVRKFTYTPDEIKVDSYIDDELYLEYKVGLAGERITNIREEKTSAGHWEEEVVFAYRIDIPDLVDKSTNKFYGTDFTFETFYQWEGNNAGTGFNMVKHATPSGTYEFFYDQSKFSQDGDYWEFEKVINKYDKYYKPFTSANLLSAIEMDGDPLVDVTYTFDDEGKITSFSVVYDGGGNPETWVLTYDCQ